MTAKKPVAKKTKTLADLDLKARIMANEGPVECTVDGETAMATFYDHTTQHGVNAVLITLMHPLGSWGECMWVNLDAIGLPDLAVERVIRVECTQKTLDEILAYIDDKTDAVVL